MPCAQRSWLAHLSLVVAKLLSFWALCHGRDPQPGPVRFPDRRQEHFIKALPEYHVVHPVRVDARGHFLSYGLHHPGAGGRRKRDLADSADQVYYRIWHEEKDLFFNLTVNRGFLSNSYIVEKRYGNLSHVKMAAPVGPHCHLQGTVLQQGTTVGTAALSACHGLVHYTLYDATYETKESKKEDLVFIFWAPECVPLKSEMIYASSKDAIKKKLTGIKHELQASCYEEVKDCCTLVEKLGGSADISLEGKPL